MTSMTFLRTSRVKIEFLSRRSRRFTIKPNTSVPDQPVSIGRVTGSNSPLTSSSRFSNGCPLTIVIRIVAIRWQIDNLTSIRTIFNISQYFKIHRFYRCNNNIFVFLNKMKISSNMRLCTIYKHYGLNRFIVQKTIA